MKKLLILLFLGMPLTSHAFTEGFKTDMATIQSDVMMKANKSISKSDMEKAWRKFDEEILKLLNSRQKWAEDDLNVYGIQTPLSIVVRGNGEMEELELGNVEVKFYNIEKGDSENPVWVAALINDMEGVVANTFHIYARNPDSKKKKATKHKDDEEVVEEVSGSKYTLAAAFEDVAGPWAGDSLIGMNIQIQKLWERSHAGALQFATYHSPLSKKSRDPKDANRQQILWKLSGRELTPILWFPEVDWHMVNDKRIEGRGEAVVPESDSPKKKK